MYFCPSKKVTLLSGNTKWKPNSGYSRLPPDRPLVNGKTAIELIWEWLNKYNLSQYINEIVYGKPNAKYYIDDKGIRFTDWNQTIKEVYEQKN